MRAKSPLLIALILLVFSVPGYAQGVGTSCDISGTWYGASDPAFQYLWTIGPAAGGRYTSIIQPGFDNQQFGFRSWTTWSGEITRIDARTFDSSAMSYWVSSPTDLPEVDIVHGRIRLVDCNTLTHTIDTYAGYLSFAPEKTPFVTPPDLNFLQILFNPPVTTLVETYRRMPTACPVCPLPTAPGVSAPTAPKKPSKPGPKPASR